jgi:acyl-CoA thioesterase
MSFVKENSGGEHLVEHAYEMPDVPGPGEEQPSRLPQGIESPFTSQQIDIFNNDHPKPHTKRTRQWIKARGRISDNGGHEVHLAALAYMSDSYFIGTISRVHKLWQIPRPLPREQKERAPWEDQSKTGAAKKESKKPDIVEDEAVLAEIRKAGPEKMRELAEQKKIVPQVGMMVSLDHTIYFHNPKDFRADEWLFTEMESPWAGDGRGLVMQRVWTREGKLVATCVQEVRSISRH